MAKVTVMVRLTLMPMSSAAPLSSETTRMALPILVLPVKRVRAIMMTTQAAMVTMASPEMIICPPSRDSEPSPTTEGKLLGLAPQTSRATF